jgi:hypothetical protein
MCVVNIEGMAKHRSDDFPCSLSLQWSAVKREEKEKKRGREKKVLNR